MTEGSSLVSKVELSSEILLNVETTGNFYFMAGKLHRHDPEDKKSYREEGGGNAKIPFI